MVEMGKDFRPLVGTIGMVWGVREAKYCPKFQIWLFFRVKRDT